MHCVFKITQKTEISKSVSLGCNLWLLPFLNLLFSINDFIHKKEEKKKENPSFPEIKVMLFVFDIFREFWTTCVRIRIRAFEVSACLY